MLTMYRSITLLCLVLLTFPGEALGVCTADPCSYTPTCPPGYIGYNSCYDSCYRVVNTATSYLIALQTCAQSGAHFFSANSPDELNYVMTLPGVQTSNTYWFGLQDWPRRGAGNTSGTWNVSSGYTPDPNGKWRWMDESTASFGSTFTVTTTPVEGFIDNATNWLIFQTAPVKGTHFVSHLVYQSSRWLVVPGTDFSTAQPYICEYSNACTTCPDGWSKYLTNCYLFDNNPTDYYGASGNCKYSYGSGITLWAPKIWYLLIYARMMANYYNVPIWIGLDKISSSVWKWADTSSMILKSGDFDVASGVPGTTDVAFRIMPDVNPESLHGVYDGFSNMTGWSSASSTSGDAWSNAYMCQQIGVSGLITTTSTTASTSTGSTSTTSSSTSNSTSSTTTTPTTTSSSTMSTSPSTSSASTTSTISESTSITTSTVASTSTITSTTSATSSTSSSSSTSTSSSTGTTTSSTITSSPTSTSSSTSSLASSSSTSTTPSTSTTSPFAAITSVSMATTIATTEDPHHCGNGILQVSMGEECDDGNNDTGDGCNSTCNLEAVARKLDIYFAIDTSFSMPLVQFPKLKMFLKTLTNLLVFDSGLVKVGVVVFGGRTAGYRLLPLAKSSEYFTPTNSHGAILSQKIAELYDKMIYFGNRGNLTNGLWRISDSSIFSYSDTHEISSEAITVVFASSPAPDMQELENQLAKLASLARRILLVSIGGDIKPKQLRRFRAWQFSVIEVPHWDKLPDNLHLIIRYLISVVI